MIKKIGKRVVAGVLTASLIMSGLVGVSGHAEENTPSEKETKTEVGFQGENPVSAENYWEVDANGNVKQAEEESGIVEENSISFYAATPQIVNFNTKSSGKTTDYTEEEKREQQGILTDRICGRCSLSWKNEQRKSQIYAGRSYRYG